MTGTFETPRKIITGVSLVDGKSVETSIEATGFEVITVEDNMKDCVKVKLSYLHASGYTDERILWNNETPVTYNQIGAWVNEDVENRIKEIV